MRRSRAAIAAALSLALCTVPMTGCSLSVGSSSNGNANANAAASANANQADDTQDKVATADFIASVKSGLQARWDLNDSTNADAMGDSEYLQFLDELVDTELDAVSPYENRTFEDSGLGSVAQAYIQSLEDAKAVVASGQSGTSSLDSSWGQAYLERVACIRKLIDDYGLTLDDRYQADLEDLYEGGEYYKDHVDEFTIVSVTKGASSYGYFTLDVAVRNNTDYAKEFETIHVSLLDSDGNIILSEDRTYPQEVEPGQEYHMQITEEDDSRVAGFSSTGYAWMSGDTYVEGKFSTTYKVMF